MSDTTRTVAIACQGGGSHSAFSAGALGRLCTEVCASETIELAGFSGTSGGAIVASLAWYGHACDEHDPADLLAAFWDDMAANEPLDRVANGIAQWQIALSRLGVPLPDVSPYVDPGARWGQAEIRRALDRRIDFDSIPSLLDGTEPALLVSAVDVRSGEFRVFREADLTADAILASAAEPRVFPAVEVDGEYYWDGLFSKNPPIKDFVTRADVAVPDEIWVVSISPQRRDSVPRTREDIENRRNELASNLSLNAEVGFVEQINEWVAAGHLPASYTHTEIRRIRFSQPNLDWRTTLDRDPDFIAELFAEGERAATDFLAERERDIVVDPPIP